jgi:hypothetical protein
MQSDSTYSFKLPWLQKYTKSFELGFQTALEYRLNFLISLISAAYPIFIQTFLWTAIYRNSTEQVVYGFTYRQMIAYTFLAGLIARIVRTGFEYEIMDDVKSGKFSKFLVQPLAISYRWQFLWQAARPVMILGSRDRDLGLNIFGGYRDCRGFSPFGTLVWRWPEFPDFYCFSSVLLDCGGGVRLRIRISRSCSAEDHPGSVWAHFSRRHVPFNTRSITSTCSMAKSRGSQSGMVSSAPGLPPAAGQCCGGRREAYVAVGG